MRMKKNKLLPRAVSFSAAAAMLVTSVATDLSPFFATEFLMASAESAESDSELKANCEHSDAPKLTVTVEKISTSPDPELDSEENYEYKVTVSGNDNNDFDVSGIEDGDTISFNADGKATISVKANNTDIYEENEQKITFSESDYSKPQSVSLSYKNYYQDLLNNLNGQAILSTAKEEVVHWGDTVVVTPKFGYQVNGSENAVAVEYKGDDSIIVEYAKIGFSCDSKYFTFSSETAKFGDNMTIKVNSDYQIAAKDIKVNDEYIVNDDYTFTVPVSASEPEISVDSTKVSYAVKLGSSNISCSLGENVYYTSGETVSFTLSSADGYTEDHAPTITDSNGNIVDVTKSDDGTSYSFTMPAAPITITDDGPQAIKYADIKSDFGAVSVKKDSVVSIENGKAKFEITPTSSAYTVDTITVTSGTEERIYTADSTDDDTLAYNPNNKTCEFDVKGFHNDITISVTYQIHLTVSAANTTDGKTGNNTIKFEEKSETLNNNKVEFNVKEDKIGSSTFTVSSDKENGWHIEKISVKYKNGGVDGNAVIYEDTDIVNSRSATEKEFTLADVFKAMGVSLPGQNISSENGEAVVDVSDVNVSDINVEVVFAQNSYEITLEECTNGFLSADPLMVVYGSKSTITATPNDEYYVSKILYAQKTDSDNSSESNELHYEEASFNYVEGTDEAYFNLTDVENDYTVKAVFEEIKDNSSIDVKIVSDSAVTQPNKNENKYIVDGENPVTVSFSDENIADVSIGENDYKAVDGGKFSDTIDEFTENVTRTYYIRDNSGVVTKLVVTFLVDATEPEINATSSSEKNFAQSTKIVVTASDNDETAEDKTGVSGISCIKYNDTQIGSNTEIKVDGETIGEVTAYEENNGVISVTITIMGDFDDKLTFTAYDNAGLSKEATVTVQNDVTKPTLENNRSTAVEITDETTSDSYNNLINTVISVTAKDENGKAKSGIADVQYTLTDMNSEPANDAVWKSISAKESNDLLKYAEVEVNDGTYTIGFNKDYSGSVWLKSIDNAGNESDAPIGYNVNNCVTNPIMSFSYENDPAKWNNNTEFSVYATEGQSIVITGINDVQFSINDKQSWTSINPEEGSSIIVDNITVAEIKPCDLPLSLQNKEGAVGYKITFVEDFSGVLYFRCKNNVVDADLWSENIGVTVQFDNTAPTLELEKTVTIDTDTGAVNKTYTEYDNEEDGKVPVGYKNVVVFKPTDPTTKLVDLDNDGEPETERTIEPSKINGQKVMYQLVSKEDEFSEENWMAFVEGDKVGNYANVSVDGDVYTLTFDKESAHNDFEGRVYFTVFDNAGNELDGGKNGSRYIEVKNVTTAPTIKVESQSPESGEWAKDIEITVSADVKTTQEDIIISKIQYSFTGSDNNDDWFEIGKDDTSIVYPVNSDNVIASASRKGNQATITFKGDYYGNIYFRAVNSVGVCGYKDKDGNQCVSFVQNDVTAPEIEKNVTVDPNEWSNNVTVTMNANDNNGETHSGISKILYSADGEYWTEIDLANLEDNSFTINGLNAKAVVVNNEVKTTPNGVTDNGTEYSYNNITLIVTFDENAKDFYGTIYFAVQDSAGNYNEQYLEENPAGADNDPSPKATVKFDKTNPTIESNIPQSNDQWEQKTTFTVTARDEAGKTVVGDNPNSGISEIQYSFDKDNWVTAKNNAKIEYNRNEIGSITVGNSETATFTFDKDYYGNFYIKALDNAQNESEVIHGVIKNDVTKPEFDKCAVDVTVNQNGTCLTFGVFKNTDLTLSLSAYDTMEDSHINLENVSGNSFSGIDEIYVYNKGSYINGTKDKSKMTYDKDEKCYTFKFPLSSHYEDISFEIIDNAGNPATASLSEILDGVNKNRVTVENKAPDISVTHSELDHEYRISDEEVWTTEKGFDYIVSIKDNEDGKNKTSGLNNGKVTINGIEYDYETLADDSDKEDDDWNKTYPNITQAGRNHIEVEAYDNAMNKSIDASNTHDVYIDSESPYVTGFIFSAKNGSPEDEKGTYTGIETKNYGYYFSSDTNVTVTVKDPINSSGIKEIVFYRIPKGSTSRDQDTVEIRSADQFDTLHNNGIDGESTASATFFVPEGFKGQIYAYVIDNVDHSSQKEKDNENTHPDGTVLEDQSRHNASSSVVISRAITNMKDIDGRDLYANDQTIQFTVSDPISGIKSVEWEVSDPLGGITSGKLEVTSDGSLIGDDGWELIADRDENLVTAVTKSIVVGNNCNDITVKLKLTDRAGNTSDTEQNFSIDKTDPKIDVKWNEEGKTYYNKDRIATVTITERNFGSVEPKITGANVSTSSWTRISHDEKNPDSDQWQAKITFHNDADYIFSLRTVDLAGNSADWGTEKFTMDQTKPTIEVKFDNNDAKNTNYYKTDRTATITVVEHNFDSKDVKVNINSTGANNVDAAESPEETKWENTGKDTYAAKVTFNKDGKYDFTVNYTDLAQNKATEYKSGEFYIDKTAPVFDIADSVKKDTAYNKEIAPEVTFSDYNLYTSSSIDKTVSVTFDRVDVNGKSAKDTISPSADGVYTAAAKSNDYMNSYFLEFNSFGQSEEIDGIYEMKISVEDMAGNTNGDTIIFSVNRYGSTYRVINDEAIELLDNYNEDIYSNKEVDVVVQEINVVEITDHKITLFKDSDDQILSEGSDYTVEEKRSAVESADSGDGNSLESGWYENDYTISKDNFVKDAYYHIDIASKDKADNDVTSTTTREDRCAPIEFVIDKTLPEIVISGVNDGDVLKESGITLNITCSDLHLTAVDKLTKNDLVVTVNGKEKAIKDIGKSTNASDDIILKLDVEADGTSDKQEVKVKIRDKADNWSDAENENIGKISFTLSATWFDLLLRNTPLMIILILLIILIIVAVIWLIFMRRRRNLNN